MLYAGPSRTGPRNVTFEHLSGVRIDRVRITDAGWADAAVKQWAWRQTRRPGRLRFDAPGRVERPCGALTLVPLGLPGTTQVRAGCLVRAGWSGRTAAVACVRPVAPLSR
ncbi:hypothetical protein GUJ93_ZPchr0004g39365 [Zizania palustris]|uniref:Uncharacterized protein n=1 Tax=Zizania palustris TaxID=103762 RepID=A0A8J5S0C6_ZIZPA|nr:hypothetical protein GUJ93_ZPchr0004g39365 [Zizania palustris]